jgi:hypothetical protein
MKEKLKLTKIWYENLVQEIQYQMKMWLLHYQKIHILKELNHPHSVLKEDDENE